MPDTLTDRKTKRPTFSRCCSAAWRPAAAPEGCPTVEQWGEAFARYLVTGDQRIPRDLVESARRVYSDLGATQREPALLHGDLHHYNVLSGNVRGWCAIDPKGVVGELEYELGAALRNPLDHLEAFASLAVVERRLEHFGLALGIDASRARGWAFAQAVLSAIWCIEDGGGEAERSALLSLACALLDSSALRSEASRLQHTLWTLYHLEPVAISKLAPITAPTIGVSQ